MGLHIFRDSRVIVVSFGGPIWWSILVARSCSFSSCVYLSTINVEHLGSINFSVIDASNVVRSEFTCCCSFFARLRVIGLFNIILYFFDILSITPCHNIKV